MEANDIIAKGAAGLPCLRSLAMLVHSPQGMKHVRDCIELTFSIQMLEAIVCGVPDDDLPSAITELANGLAVNRSI